MIIKILSILVVLDAAYISIVQINAPKTVFFRVHRLLGARHGGKIAPVHRYRITWVTNYISQRRKNGRAKSGVFPFPI